MLIMATLIGCNPNKGNITSLTPAVQTPSPPSSPPQLPPTEGHYKQTAKKGKCHRRKKKSAERVHTTKKYVCVGTVGWQ